MLKNRPRPAPPLRSAALPSLPLHSPPCPAPPFRPPHSPPPLLLCLPTSRYATKDAMLIGRLHTHMPGWLDANVAFIRGGGYSISGLISQVQQDTLVLWCVTEGRVGKGMAHGLGMAHCFCTYLPATWPPPHPLPTCLLLPARPSTPPPVATWSCVCTIARNVCEYLLVRGPTVGFCCSASWHLSRHFHSLT